MLLDAIHAKPGQYHKLSTSMIAPIVARTRSLARFHVTHDASSTCTGIIWSLVVLDPDVRVAHNLRWFVAPGHDAPVAAVVRGLVESALDLGATAQFVVLVVAPGGQAVRLLRGSDAPFAAACHSADQRPVKGDARRQDGAGDFGHEPDQDICRSVWM